MIHTEQKCKIGDSLKLLEITAELKRVMKPSAVMFWNHGDSYGGSGGDYGGGVSDL